MTSSGCTVPDGPPLSLAPARVEEVRRAVVDTMQNLAPPTRSAATMALEVLSGLATVAFLLFFLLKDGPRLWEWAPHGTAPSRAQRGRQPGAAGCQTLIGYVCGMVGVALVDAVRSASRCGSSPSPSRCR
jgi:predicted PurR-regulated permease PerM